MATTMSCSSDYDKIQTLSSVNSPSGDSCSSGESVGDGGRGMGLHGQQRRRRQQCRSRRNNNNRDTANTIAEAEEMEYQVRHAAFSPKIPFMSRCVSHTCHSMPGSNSDIAFPPPLISFQQSYLVSLLTSDIYLLYLCPYQIV